MSSGIWVPILRVDRYGFQHSVYKVFIGWRCLQSCAAIGGRPVMLADIAQRNPARVTRTLGCCYGRDCGRGY